MQLKIYLGKVLKQKGVKTEQWIGRSFSKGSYRYIFFVIKLVQYSPKDYFTNFIFSNLLIFIIPHENIPFSVIPQYWRMIFYVSLLVFSVLCAEACPAGWNGTEGGDLCYLVSGDSMNWYSAVEVNAERF